MPNDATTPSNKIIDDICAAATSSGELQAALEAYHISLINKEIATPPPSVTAPQPVASPRTNAYRVIYPYGNSRFELVGADEADLDRQEAQIRKMYERK